MELHQISYHSHVSPTNHKFIKHNSLMPISNQPTNNSCFPFHTLHKKISFSFNLIQHTWHHTSCICGKTRYQTGKQPHQGTNQNYNTKRAPVTLRLEVIAQASPFRLGESSSSGTVASTMRLLIAQNEGLSPERQFSQKPGRASASLA